MFYHEDLGSIFGEGIDPKVAITASSTTPGLFSNASRYSSVLNAFTTRICPKLFSLQNTDVLRVIETLGNKDTFCGLFSKSGYVLKRGHVPLLSELSIQPLSNK